jgi:hypothetical protein
MPITLDDFDVDPETKPVLLVALKMTRESLGLADDFANGIIAKRIVELAKVGERNPLCTGTDTGIIQAPRPAALALSRRGCAPPGPSGETRAGGALTLFCRGGASGGLSVWGAPSRSNNTGHRQTVPALPGMIAGERTIMEPIPPSRIGNVRGSGIPLSRPRCMTIPLAPPTKRGPFSQSQTNGPRGGPHGPVDL